jgi:hypothetical protein
VNASRWPGVLLPVAALLAAAWSAVPLAVWWDDADPAYFARSWQAWGWGSVVAGLALALALALSRGRATDVVFAGWRRLAALRAGWFVLAVALLVAVETVLFSTLVFDGNPRSVDGFAQLFQARIFLAGRLWADAPPEVGNFATLHMIVGPERWFTQYPPGQSVVLAAGLALGAWWLLHPLIAGLFVAATYRVARWCADDTTARLTLVLVALSPFVLAVAGSELSHISGAALGMGAAAAAIAAVSGGSPVRGAALAGLALGAMTAFRPLDAVAAAVPVGLILIVWSSRRALALASVTVAGVLATLPTLWYNSRTTGDWLQFGYRLLWGPELSLGFHPVPWGVPLTVARAVARSGLDLHQLNTYLVDGTVPPLLLIAVGWVAGRRYLATRDAVPWAGALALSALLFAYWHRDVFYGPRLLYGAVAWWLLLLARGVVLLRRTGPPVLGRVVTVAVLAAVTVGLVAITPGRISAYRRATPLFSLHPDRDAERAGVRHAVVVIPDGWGSRLIVRMWAAGVPVRRSSRLYAAIDACALEQALDAAERDGGARADLLATLDSLAALRRPGARGVVTEDPGLRLPADGRLAEACAREIETDRRGFLVFAPFLYLNAPGLDGDIVWARDLGPRNAPLFRRYSGRAFYRYAPLGRGGAPVLTPIAPDGAR